LVRLQQLQTRVQVLAPAVVCNCGATPPAGVLEMAGVM
jgi:hypothetical protein